MPENKGLLCRICLARQNFFFQMVPTNLFIFKFCALVDYDITSQNIKEKAGYWPCLFSINHFLSL